jgi:dynein heavy chain
MKETINVTEDKYAVAENKTAELLDTLTAKATILEKLKAKLGLAPALNAFLLQLNEMTGDDDEETGLLQGGNRAECVVLQNVVVCVELL